MRTQTTSAPRLSITSDGADEPIRFERRGASRTPARAQGVATFIEPDGKLWLARVSITDRSAEGLGARSPVRVAPMASFYLALDDGGEVRGTVSHARASGGAFRLGLRCARAIAA